MKETDDLTQKETVYHRLVELESLITNALGALVESTTIANTKIPKPKKVDVSRLAAKPYTTGTPETFKKSGQKLMPNNDMLYKEPAFDESGDPPVEPVSTPEDSQSKDVAASIEQTLEKIRRLKHTLEIEAADAMQPTLR